jgi:hypothetical protein
MSLRFDPDEHRYWLDGHVVPSVTQVLSLVTDYQWATAEHRERGTAVHWMLELADQDDLDESALDPRLIPYLDAWREFRAQTGFTVQAIETRLASRAYRYAGTEDRFGLFQGEFMSLDIKSSAQLIPATALQTAGYQVARQEWIGGPLCRRGAVQVKPDGTFAWKEYTDPNDRHTFICLVIIAHWRARHDR